MQIITWFSKTTGCLFKPGEYCYSQEVLRFALVSWNRLHISEKAQHSLKC